MNDTKLRLTHLAAALQWDRGRWIGLLSIVVLLDVIFALGDGVGAALRYDRSALAAGGWWRLLTAHAVHLDLHHLVLNELGMVLLWSLFADAFDGIGWIVVVSCGALSIGSGLWWLSPRVGWYVGASGILHAAFAAGTVRHLMARVWDRWILLLCLCFKLTYEQVGGPEPPLVVVDAHLYGALSGFAVGTALSGWGAIIRHRQSKRSRA